MTEIINIRTEIIEYIKDIPYFTPTEKENLIKKTKSIDTLRELINVREWVRSKTQEINELLEKINK